MASRSQKKSALRKWREARNFTLGQAASALQVSLTTYWYLERGRVSAATRTVIRIAQVTGVPAAEIARVA